MVDTGIETFSCSKAQVLTSLPAASTDGSATSSARSPAVVTGSEAVSTGISSSPEQQAHFQAPVTHGLDFYK